MRSYIYVILTAEALQASYLMKLSNIKQGPSSSICFTQSYTVSEYGNRLREIKMNDTKGGT